MDAQRMRDRLVGAAVAVVVLTLVAVLALWAVSDPATDDARPGPSPPSPSPSRAPAVAAPPVPDPPSDLTDEELWLGDLVLDAGTVVAAGSLLRDVEAVGRDVRTGPDGVVAGWMAVEATVPFDVVAQELGDGIVVTRAGPDRATVERTVQFAGRRISVVATGRVEVDDGVLVVEPTSVDFGGPAFLSDALGALARRLVTIEHELEGLPEGLELQDVTVIDDGFRAELEGRDVDVAV